MADLTASVAGAAVDRFAAVPTVSLDLRVTDGAGGRIEALALRAQIRIEPQHRRYTEDEVERLTDQFGAPSQWGESLRPFLWCQVGTVVGAFEGTAEVSLPLACTYDFEVSGARYLAGLDEGEIPLLLLFNGTIFRMGEGGLSVEPVPWTVEARYRLPVATWRAAMDHFFPGAAWLRLRRDTLDALGRVKNREALTTFEQVVERLLEQCGETV